MKHAHNTYKGLSDISNSQQDTFSIVKCNVCNTCSIETRQQGEIHFCCPDCQEDINDNGPADAIINDNVDYHKVDILFDGENNIQFADGM